MRRFWNCAKTQWFYNWFMFHGCHVRTINWGKLWKRINYAASACPYVHFPSPYILVSDQSYIWAQKSIKKYSDKTSACLIDLRPKLIFWCSSIWPVIKVMVANMARETSFPKNPENPSVFGWCSTVQCIACCGYCDYPMWRTRNIYMREGAASRLIRISWRENLWISYDNMYHQSSLFSFV